MQNATNEESVKTFNGSEFLTIERVSYGKKSTPDELKEYKLYGRSSPVGSHSEWMEFAIHSKMPGLRIVELDGSVTFAFADQKGAD